MPTYEKLILTFSKVLGGVTGRLGPGSAGGNRDGEEPDDDGGSDVDRNGGGEGC